MPTVISCTKCDAVLAEYETVPMGDLWYHEFYSKHNGKCPKCGHELPKPIDYKTKMEVEVTAAPKPSFLGD